MMNAGIVMPDDGYLQGVKDLLHAHGALLAFDEVKTGATIHYGGATKRFGVTPDLLCLAKSVGGGLPCGAIGGSEEVMGWIAEGKIDQVGTFNGNPLTMAAMRGDADRDPDARRLHRVRPAGRDPARGVRRRDRAHRHRRLHHGAVRPAARSPTAASASATTASTSRCPTSWRTSTGWCSSTAACSWRRGASRENWTLSVQHSEEDVRRYVDNFDYLGKAAHRMKAVVFEEHGGPGGPELHGHPRARAGSRTRC